MGTGMVQYMTEANQQMVTLHTPTPTREEFLNAHGQHIIPVLTEKPLR